MNYEFYRGATDVDSASAALYTVFNLDTFRGKTLFLSSEQIDYMLERYKLIKNLPKDAVASSVFSCLYENMGGTKTTDPTQVAAFAYICFVGHNFRFNSFFEQILKAIQLENIFTYITQSALVVPHKAVLNMRSQVDSFIWEDLIKRHDFVVNASDESDPTEFLTKIEAETQAYIDTLKNTNNLLTNLDIDLSTDEN